MHLLFFLVGLAHATLLSIIGFFVLFAASRAAGLVKTIGNVLGAWLFILAAVALIASIAAPMIGGPHMGMRMMMGPHARWMRPGPPAFGPPPPAQAPAPAQPAAPASK